MKLKSLCSCRSSAGIQPISDVAQLPHWFPLPQPCQKTESLLHPRDMATLWIINTINHPEQPLAILCSSPPHPGADGLWNIPRTSCPEELPGSWETFWTEEVKYPLCFSLSLWRANLLWATKCEEFLLFSDTAKQWGWCFRKMVCRNWGCIKWHFTAILTAWLFTFQAFKPTRNRLYLLQTIFII